MLQGIRRANLKMLRMSRSQRIKWLAIAAGAVWILAAGSQQFSFSSSHKGYPWVRSGCKGTFSQRYSCSQSNMLARDRQTFVRGLGKVAIVFGPPLLLAASFNPQVRRRLFRKRRAA
ncbi:MAG: hypothetical protein V3R88_11140 [Alphaproteobacteria bacterium]